MSYKQPGVNLERIVAIDKLFNIQDTVAFSFCFARSKTIVNNKMRKIQCLGDNKVPGNLILDLSALLFFITH